MSSDLSKRLRREDREFTVSVLKSHWPISLFTILIVLLIILSLVFNWPQLASRLGALLVACGVFVEFIITRKIYIDVQNKFAHWINQEIKEKSRYEAQERIKSNFPHMGFNSLMRNHRSMIDWWVKVSPRMTNPFLYIELILVSIGTLFWAFGDWLVCSLHKLEWSTCS